jgi:hypothetical protein
VKSIELVEIYLEPTHNRIGKRNTKILAVFGTFEGIRRGLKKKETPGIDRARRVLLETIIGYIGTGQGANPGRYFSNLCVF